MFVVVVFLDLKRAFETVDRNLLIKKLSSYEVGDICLNWFENYLQNRLQRVVCNNVCSNMEYINVGVVQGSTLGPLLFILYLNDIFKNFNKCNFHLFADDTIVYISGYDIVEIINTLNLELKNLDNWLKFNKLKLNTSKSNFMVLCSDNNYIKFTSSNVHVSIGGDNLELVSSVKYLGVVVDRKLKFTQHINYICTKIAKKVGLIGRLRNTLSVSAKKTIYNVIVLPYFSYSSTLLYMCRQSDISRLQKLQNRAMRYILNGNKYSKIQNMLKTLGWLDIQSFIKFNCMMFIHKINLGMLPPYLSDLLTNVSDIHSYDTRQKQNFYLNKVNLTKSQNCLFYKGINDYNELPEHIKSYSLIKFKVECKKLLKNY